MLRKQTCFSLSRGETVFSLTLIHSIKILIAQKGNLNLNLKKKSYYLFIWLHCSWLQHVGSSSLTRGRIWSPALGVRNVRHWTTKEVPGEIFRLLNEGSETQGADLSTWNSWQSTGCGPTNTASTMYILKKWFCTNESRLQVWIQLSGQHGWMTLDEVRYRGNSGSVRLLY